MVEAVEAEPRNDPTDPHLHRASARLSGAPSAKAGTSHIGHAREGEGPKGLSSKQLRESGRTKLRKWPGPMMFSMFAHNSTKKGRHGGRPAVTRSTSRYARRTASDARRKTPIGAGDLDPAAPQQMLARRASGRHSASRAPRSASDEDRTIAKR